MKTMLISLAALLLASLPARAADDLALTIAAYRVTATDVEASGAFYARHFGLLEVARYDGGTIVLADARGSALVLTPAAGPIAIAPGACATHLNFAVPDLDAAVAGLRAEGVEILGHSESAVGRYTKFVDPSGNVHNVKQLFEVDGAAHIYNAGIVVTDMARSRAFYEGVLGFEPIGEQYYPPVVPMVPVGGKQFILSDKGAEHAAPYDLASGAAWTGLAFEADDLDSAMIALRARGVRFLADEPVTSGPVRLAMFADPDGNVHELIEHITPARAAAPADADLAYLEGTWRSESDDGAVIEEHWLAPENGSISGMLRWMGPDGSVRLLELLTVTPEDGVGVFRWRHFDGVLTPWASEADGPSVVTIESFDNNTLVMVGDPDAGGVQRMTYDGSTPGLLTATLEFGPDSGRDPIVIEFEKQ
ncbi:MAG: hypothetical protein DHS20C14_06590 [Phycisphaeraceae bacterium]|nr:MAG: hypothetical protein DHS20C14_06590 [Phycisphaeraceae bacterium]